MHRMMVAGFLFLFLALPGHWSSAQGQGGTGASSPQVPPGWLEWVEENGISDLGVRAYEAIDRGDCETALSLFDRLGKGMPDFAPVIFGELSEKGNCVPLDLEKAASLYAEAAGNGVVAGQLRLGHMRLYGLGTPRDRARAVLWFRKACLNLAWASEAERIFLFEVFLGDRGIPPELMKEFDRVRQVENGTPAQKYAAALLIQRGREMPRVCEAAKRWMRDAASQGHAEAQYELADWNFHGTCVERSDLFAERWLHTAAWNGHLAAQVRFGRLLMKSDGPQVNRIEAFAWLLRAQDGGAEVADDLEALRAILDDLDIKVAERWARDPDFLNPGPH